MSTQPEANGPMDVFGVGNALVDILALVDDDFVREHDLPKGGMTLVDTEKQGALLHDLEQHKLEMQAGGSAANTIIAAAQSGGTGFYTGKVARDTHGEFYRLNMLEAGGYEVDRAAVAAQAVDRGTLGSALATYEWSAPTPAEPSVPSPKALSGRLLATDACHQRRRELVARDTVFSLISDRLHARGVRPGHGDLPSGRPDALDAVFGAVAPDGDL